MSDMRTVLRGAEDLLKQAAASTGDRASELREKGLSALRQAKEKAQDIQDNVANTSKQAARAADDYVHAHPWRAIGLASGIGLLLGLIINRK